MKDNKTSRAAKILSDINCSNYNTPATRKYVNIIEACTDIPEIVSVTWISDIAEATKLTPSVVGRYLRYTKYINKYVEWKMVMEDHIEYTQRQAGYSKVNNVTQDIIKPKINMSLREFVVTYKKDMNFFNSLLSQYETKGYLTEKQKQIVHDNAQPLNIIVDVKNTNTVTKIMNFVDFVKQYKSTDIIAVSFMNQYEKYGHLTDKQLTCVHNWGAFYNIEINVPITEKKDLMEQIKSKINFAKSDTDKAKYYRNILENCDKIPEKITFSWIMQISYHVNFHHTLVGKYIKYTKYNNQYIAWKELMANSFGNNHSYRHKAIMEELLKLNMIVETTKK